MTRITECLRVVQLLVLIRLLPIIGKNKSMINERAVTQGRRRFRGLLEMLR